MSFLGSHQARPQAHLAPRTSSSRRTPRALSLTWEDGARTSATAQVLRQQCPCAACVDEWTNRRTLDPARVPDEPPHPVRCSRWATTRSPSPSPTGTAPASTRGPCCGSSPSPRAEDAGRHAVNERYRLVRPLASGGMAELFLGICPRRRGLREARGHQARSSRTWPRTPAIASMFVAEARLATHLQHQNLVSVYDVGNDATGPVPGDGAGQRVGPGRARPPPEAAQHAAPAAPGGLHRRPGARRAEPRLPAHAQRPAGAHGPPGHLPVQHPRVARGRGEAHRLRHRQAGGRLPRHPARRLQGQALLRRARGHHRGRRHRRQRPVLPGHRPLRAAHRPAPVQPLDGGHHRRHGHRQWHAADRSRACPSPWPRW